MPERPIRFIQALLLAALAAAIAAPSTAIADGRGNSGHHAQAAGHEKIVICHATGSQSNPFVEIEVSRHAGGAHRAHQDGGDVFVTSGACPRGNASVAGAQLKHGEVPVAHHDNARRERAQVQGAQQAHLASEEHEKVTICHSTGSLTNPFVLISVSTHAIAAHAGHQNGRDVIPAPASGCPQGAAVGADQAVQVAGVQVAGPQGEGQAAGVQAGIDEMAAPVSDEPPAEVAGVQVAGALPVTGGLGPAAPVGILFGLMLAAGLALRRLRG